MFSYVCLGVVLVSSFFPFRFCVSLLHFLYIPFCRPSCCGQAGPDEAEEKEVDERSRLREKRKMWKQVWLVSPTSNTHSILVPTMDSCTRRQPASRCLGQSSYPRHYPPCLGTGRRCARCRSHRLSHLFRGRLVRLGPGQWLRHQRQCTGQTTTSTSSVTWHLSKPGTRPRTAFSKLALAEIRRMCRTLVVETAYRGSGVTLAYRDGDPEPQAVPRGPCASGTRVTVTEPLSAD
jgi:hypothetical protein